MELLRLILSVNKIALLSFCITSFAIIIEIYRLNSQKGKSKKLTIPEFIPTFKKTHIKTAKIKSNEKNHPVNKTNSLLLIIIVLLFILSGLFILISVIIEKRASSTQVIIPQETQAMRVISSSGISLYDNNWNVLTTTNLKNIPTGQSFFIGIATINNADITMARIRVNSKSWLPNHETKLFNKKFNIFYSSYTVTTPATLLEIEAQLYNQRDGWLGQ